MSFFEQMMKLTLPQKNPASRPSTPSQQPEPSQPRLTQPPAFTPRNPNSSRSLTLQEDEGWEDVADEPPIIRIKIGPKPHLLHNVLSKKEQMMRQMLQKKRQFQLKKRNLCREKHEVELESEIARESQKFMESRLSSVKPSKVNQQVQQKRNTSSGKLFSDNKSKPLLNLSQSVCSATLQMQMLSSPLADQFNKEIMLKLLNIIQQDRSRAPLQQSVEQSKQQKESPIIINNIMKTPMETITRDIFEREMKIKVLQNTRSQRQYEKHSNMQKKQCHPCREFTEGQFVLTDRTNLEPSNQGFEMVSGSCKKQTSSTKQAPSGPKEPKMKENCIPEKPLIRSFSKQIIGEIKMGIEQSTKNNSSQNSRVKQLDQSIVPPDHRKREFRQPPVRPIQNIPKEIVEPRQKIKAPVKLQIPLEDQTSLEGLTLAEAFKKRVGRLKSEQKRSEKLQQKSENKLPKALEAFPSQMTISITEKMTEYHSQLDFSAPTSAKMIGIETENPLSKRTNNTRPRSKVASMRQTSSKKVEGPSKKMSEPSKELMDRLIYGQKAKMSKEEMYALTKKNYNNLPEVQAKRREEEKRMMEQERQNKAREYQKTIRSKKAQMKT